MEKLERLFGVEKPIIGMFHLAGGNREEKIERALREMEIYRKNGVSGGIVENYCGSSFDIPFVIEELNAHKEDFVLGVNCLGNPYSGFEIARNYGGGFVQFDNIEESALDVSKYVQLRRRFPGILVLGGVGFKGQPESENCLEYDLGKAKNRCDAVVTTGEGTGIETPTMKLIQYKKILGNFPLIEGAGANPGNACEHSRGMGRGDSLKNIYGQPGFVDAAIVGSCFKPGGNVNLMVEEGLVKVFMRKWIGRKY